MARLACLGMLTFLLVAAPAFGQAPPDAKAPSSDDYVVVDATDLSSAVLRPEFKWPQGTIIDSQESSCGALGFGPHSSGEKDPVPEGFKPLCFGSVNDASSNFTASPQSIKQTAN